MNQDYVVRAYVAWNLEEAQEELTRILAAMKPGSEVDEAEFHVCMVHLYHHLNTAWNARNASSEDTASPTQEQFDAWSRFLEDLEPL